MSLKGPYALATSRHLVWHATWGAQLPHLDRLVKTAADKVLAAWRECNTIHAVLVTIGAFQTFRKIATIDVPYTNAPIQ